MKKEQRDKRKNEKEDYRERNSMVAVNIQALVECTCYLIFGILLFYLTYSGKYLKYVTPRMKPYLYGLSVLMFIWTLAEGRFLLIPRYKARIARSFIFIIPILLMVIPPKTPEESGMAGYDDNGVFSSIKRDSKKETEETTQAAKTGTEDEQETAADQTKVYKEETATGAADVYTSGAEEENPWYELNGLNEEARTITISDDDYYTWMYELSNYYEKYIGWTVEIKGFVYRSEDITRKCDFVLVRLAMWCCAADLTPMGFLINAEKGDQFQDNEWVTVKGTLGITGDGNSIILQAESIEPAQKPEEEYIYPYS